MTDQRKPDCQRVALNFRASTLDGSGGVADRRNRHCQREVPSFRVRILGGGVGIFDNDGSCRR